MQKSNPRVCISVNAMGQRKPLTKLFDPAKMIILSQIALPSVLLVPASLPIDLNLSKDELMQKATDFFCEVVGKENQQLMTSHDLSLYEGMALGYVIGIYGENASALREFGGDIESVFARSIKDKCALNTKIKSHPLVNTIHESRRLIR